MNATEINKNLEMMARTSGYKSFNEMLVEAAVYGDNKEPYAQGDLDNVVKALQEGKKLYIFKATDLEAREMEIKGDKLEAAKQQMKAPVAPKEVPAPGFFSRVADFFMKIGGSRNEACAKYDQYQADLAALPKNQDLFKSFKTIGEERIKSKPAYKANEELAEKSMGKAEELKGKFEEFKKANKFELYAEAIAKKGPERTAEEQKVVDIFARIDLTKPLGSQPIHLANNKFYRDPFAERINNEYWNNPTRNDGLKAEGNDLMRDLGFITKPGGDAKYEDYAMAARAIDNLQHKLRPDEMDKDVNLLRDMVVENVAYMNKMFKDAGIKEDSVSVSADSRAAMYDTSDKAFCHAQATSNLATILCKYEIEKGIADPGLAQLSIRAKAYWTFGTMTKPEMDRPNAEIGKATFKEALDVSRQQSSKLAEVSLLKALPEAVVQRTALMSAEITDISAAKEMFGRMPEPPKVDMEAARQEQQAREAEKQMEMQKQVEAQKQMEAQKQQMQPKGPMGM